MSVVHEAQFLCIAASTTRHASSIQWFNFCRIHILHNPHISILSSPLTKFICSLIVIQWSLKASKCRGLLSSPYSSHNLESALHSVIMLKAKDIKRYFTKSYHRVIMCYGQLCQYASLQHLSGGGAFNASIRIRDSSSLMLKNQISELSRRLPLFGCRNPPEKVIQLHCRHLPPAGRCSTSGLLGLPSK
ncbi:hypothetical protein ABKN59_007177 [Abortiporus biennis]